MLYGRALRTSLLHAVRTKAQGSLPRAGRYCTCAVRAPASGVPYAPRTVAPQELNLPVGTRNKLMQLLDTTDLRLTATTRSAQHLAVSLALSRVLLERVRSTPPPPATNPTSSSSFTATSASTSSASFTSTRRTHCASRCPNPNPNPNPKQVPASLLGLALIAVWCWFERCLCTYLGLLRASASPPAQVGLA